MAVANVDVRVDSTGAVRSLNQLNAASRATAAGVNGLKAAIAPLLAAFSAIEAIKFTIVKTSELETQTRSLQVLTGSADKARQIIQQLQQLGAVTPFTSTELIDAAKRLQAFGVQAENVVQTTRRLADVAGATGAELQGLVTAYGQVQAKGRLQGEELLQFQERGIALQEELRKMYGLSGEEFQKALSKGRISAEAVEVAIVRLTEKGGKYANGAVAQSSTLAGKFSTLKDGVESIAKIIGEKLSPALKFVLDLANTAIDAINKALAGPDYKKANDQLFNIRARISELKQAIQQAEKAGIGLARSIEIKGVDGQVLGGGQPVLPGMRYELQQLESQAAALEKRLKDLRQASRPAPKPSTVTPPLLAEQPSGRQQSMSDLLGGRIQQQLELLQAVRSTSKEQMLGFAAQQKNAGQAKRMVEIAHEYVTTQDEISALQETLAARAKVAGQLIAGAKDKEDMRLAIAQQDDAIRAAINVKQEQLNTIAARHLNLIIAANNEQQKQDAKSLENGQSKLQQLLDEQELLQARLAGNEAEIILKQQLRDITKEMTPEQIAQAKAASQAIESLKQQLTVAEQMKSIYTDIGMSIKSGVVDAIQGAIDGTKTLGEVANGLLKNIANKLLDVAINFALFGAMSGTGTGGGLLGGLFRKRATGGSVTGGQPYLVGERGPELFMPGRSGGIAPSGSFGGGPTVVINVDASGTSVQGNQPEGQALGRAVAAAVQAELIKQKRPGGILA